jgi:hypothetical protein
MRSTRPLLAALAALAGALLLTAAGPAPRNLDRALAAQRQLATERPTDAAVFNDLGNLLAVAGDTRGAEEAYRKAIELDPKDPGPRFNFGLLLVEAGERYKAWRQFHATVELEPRHAWAWYELGSLYEDWGLEKRSRKAYARAFSLDRRLADAHYNPAVLDSAQATPAMLMAWGGSGAAAATAPRGYSDGARIAGLLIDVPKTKAPAEPEAEPAQASESGGFVRVTPPAGGAPAATPRSGAGAGDEVGESVEPEDLEGMDAGAEGKEGGPPRVITGADLGAPRPLNQVAPGQSGAPDPKGSTLRGRQGYPQRPLPYRPGRSSTGRLEPLLLPAVGSPDPLDPLAG